MIRRPPRSTLFPSTPLFRSVPGTGRAGPQGARPPRPQHRAVRPLPPRPADVVGGVVGPAQLRDRAGPAVPRSEEHTSELQSRQYLVCRLLLEKKNIQVITVIRLLDSSTENQALAHTMTLHIPPTTHKHLHYHLRRAHL